MFPSEIVNKYEHKEKIKKMLDDRWSNGWKLDRIIDHGRAHNTPHILIYYFIPL